MILFSDFAQAFANLRAQKTRTLLTALGIVFGVGSVIGMLAIGSGAKEESLRFIEQLGVRNVLVESRPATSQEEFQQRRRSSPGLSARDVRILKANIEALETLSARSALHPARVLPKPARDIPELYGVEPSYSIIHSLHLAEGKFFDEADDAASATVCVLGEGAKVNLLGYGPAVGKFVKVNDSWMEVVGVLTEQVMAGSQNSGGRHARRQQHHLHPPQHHAVPLLGPGQQHEGRARWHRPPPARRRRQHRSRQGRHLRPQLHAPQHAGIVDLDKFADGGSVAQEIDLGAFAEDAGLGGAGGVVGLIKEFAFGKVEAVNDGVRRLNAIEFRDVESQASVGTRAGCGALRAERVSEHFDVGFEDTDVTAAFPGEERRRCL